jgi:hypothetical protein
MGQVFKWVFIGFNAVMGLWVIRSIAVIKGFNASPTVGLENFGTNVGFTIGFSLILMIWAFGGLILGMLTLATRPTR